MLSMPWRLKIADGVIAEAGLERFQLAFEAGVGAEFVDAVLRKRETGEQGEAAVKVYAP